MAVPFVTRGSSDDDDVDDGAAQCDQPLREPLALSVRRDGHVPARAARPQMPRRPLNAPRPGAVAGAFPSGICQCATASEHQSRGSGHPVDRRLGGRVLRLGNSATPIVGPVS